MRFCARVLMGSAIVAWLAGPVFAGGQAGPDDPVARIGSFEIGRAHMEVQLRDYWRRTGRAVNLSEPVRLAVLNARIDRYAVVEIARERGWTTDPEAATERARIERKALMEEYQRRFVHDQVRVGEAELRDLYLRMNTRVRASHLYARNRAEADSLYARLQAGTSFEALAEATFTDPTLRSNGGDVGYFTVDEMDIAFEDRAFRMRVGEVSEPVQTASGYSIIKVTDRVTHPLLTEAEFENRKRDIEPLAIDQQRELALRRHLRERIGAMRFDEAVVERLWRLVGTRAPGEEIALDAATRASVVARDGRFVFTVADYLLEAALTPEARRAGVRTAADFRDQLEGLAFRRYALGVVRSHPAFDSAFVAGAIEETFYSYLHERFDRQLQLDVRVSDAEIRSTYYAAPDAWQSGVVVDLSEMILTDEDLAVRAAEEARSGVPFADLVRRYGAPVPSAASGGRIGMVPLAELGSLESELAQVRPGDIAGPFRIDVNRFVVLAVHDRLASRPLTYEEALPVIRRTLTEDRISRLRTAILSEARARYGVSIDMNLLNSLTIEL